MTYYYHATIRVDGLLWYHDSARPASQYYVHHVKPVIHNYGFTLALAGYITDPDTGYASVFGVTRYKPPIQLFKRYGVYAYPLTVTRALLGEVLVSGLNEAIVTIRGRSRLAYPTFSKNVVLMPGSTLETLVVSEDKLPANQVVRIGAKRNGVLKVSMHRVNAEYLENAQTNRPYNTADTVETSGSTVILQHPAGDIAAYGVASEAIAYKIGKQGRQKTIIVPSLRGL